MLKNERQNQILQLIQQAKSMSLAELNEFFDVSSMTIWRDLDDLARAGLIKRIRGGALARERARSEFQDITNLKDNPHADKKAAIGNYAATNLVSKGDSITIEAGSTASSIVPHLAVPNLTILTNGLLTSLMVYKTNPDIMLMCSGGVLIETGAFIGPQAEDFFANFHTQKAFISAEGLTIKEEFTDSTPLYTNLKKIMTTKADKTIMMLDSSKIGFSSLVHVMKFNDIDILVTDSEAPIHVLDSIKDLGVDIHIVEI